VAKKLQITATIRAAEEMVVVVCDQLPLAGTGKNQNEAVKNMIVCLYTMVNNAGSTLTDVIDALMVDAVDEGGN